MFHCIALEHCSCLEVPTLPPDFFSLSYPSVHPSSATRVLFLKQPMIFLNFPDSRMTSYLAQPKASHGLSFATFTPGLFVLIALPYPQHRVTDPTNPSLCTFASQVTCDCDAFPIPASPSPTLQSLVHLFKCRLGSKSSLKLSQTPSMLTSHLLSSTHSASALFDFYVFSSKPSSSSISAFSHFLPF